MSPDIIILVIVIAVLILLSGFFSCSETGLTVASRARLHKLASEGDKRAQKALDLRKDKDSLIGALVLGFNLSNIIASMLAASVTTMLFDQDGYGLVVATAIMTFLLLVFGEIIPKTIAFHNPDKVAIIVAPIWVWIVRILSPITKVLQTISLIILKCFGYKGAVELVDPMETLRGTIELQHSEGKMIKHDRDMLGSILDLAHIEVGEIMIHRRNMETICLDDDAAKMIADAVRTKHTRLPVWQGSEDNIIGILHTKDVLRLDRDEPRKEDIQALLNDPMFVPETTSLKDQMQSFREKRNHIAMVVDEYGDLQGLVTLEDILEEIVGQIDDEHDRKIKGVKKQQDGSYIVRGNVNIRDLNRELELDLPVEEDANTVAGIVLRAAERIPNVGEKFEYAGYEFTVLGKMRHQLTNIKLKSLPQEDDEQE